MPTTARHWPSVSTPPPGSGSCTTRRRSPRNPVVASTVVDPATFFWITRFTPSRYALYQSLPSVQLSTPPRLLFVNELSDPVAITSESVADGPRTAL